MQSYIKQEQRYCAQNYAPLPVVLNKGKGVWLWDTDGKKYLDMMSAYSAVSHGHCHPRLVKTLTQQAKTLTVTSRAFYADALAPFLKKLCQISKLDMALPMNTGAEAVETAIKAARLWGYRLKNIPKNKAEIIVADGNFHGRTTTIVGFSSERTYKDDFGPYSKGFSTVPFGNTKALEQAITKNTCAFLVEPMQGEGGIIIPPEGWLKDVQRICKKHNVLLILDEIQTGLGRTGKWFAWQHELETPPDGLIVGKALGGGLLPASAFIATKQVMKLFEPGSHGSTFGGNPLAARVALEALNILQEDKLIQNSHKLGTYLQKALRKIDCPYITNIRGKGLWIGVEFSPLIPAANIVKRLATKGLLTKETHETVIRFAPPLIISQPEIDLAAKICHSVFTQLEPGTV